MQDFLQVRSIDELNHALSRQRALTRRALNELDQLQQRFLPQALNQASEPEMEQQWLRFKEEEIKLLTYYASLPTLTEFEETPGLNGLARDGGTFGVAALVGEGILMLTAQIEPRFIRAHRLVMMVLLRELDSPSPQDEDIVETVLRYIRIELSEAARQLSEPERHTRLRGLVQPLVDAMIIGALEYRLVTSEDRKQFILTHLGKRTLLHMFDSQRFIDTISAAHQKFQKESLAI